MKIYTRKQKLYNDKTCKFWKRNLIANRKEKGTMATHLVRRRQIKSFMALSFTCIFKTVIIIHEYSDLVGYLRNGFSNALELSSPQYLRSPNSPGMSARTKTNVRKCSKISDYTCVQNYMVNKVIFSLVDASFFIILRCIGAWERVCEGKGSGNAQ